MDFGTPLGLLITFFFVVMSMVTGSGIGTYIDTASVFIVVMGSIGIVIAGYPFPSIMESLKAAVKTFVYSPQSHSDLIQQLVEFAIRARRDGILSLESAEEDMKDEFLRKGVRLAVDGSEPDVIRSILETDLENMDERHKSAAAMYTTFVEVAPSMGMIGTLVGLVAMLQAMSDPSSIGPAMAVALITTLYGAIIAYMLCTPIVIRLSIRDKQEQLSRQIMIAGIMSIQAGDNPRIVEQKLNAYLPPTQRKTQFD